jgi:protein-S-isoprenylcysteine O-methyltransferase Ste14
MVWAWGVSLPVMFVNGEAVDPPFGCAADVAGIVIFALSFLLEVAADLQKDAFRSNPANRGRVCDAGVWGYSRHPNFAGEIGMWWGLFILASPVFSAAASAGAAGSGWGYATILSPLLTFLILMCGSGMPTAEGDNQQRYMKTRRCVRACAGERLHGVARVGLGWIGGHCLLCVVRCSTRESGRRRLLLRWRGCSPVCLTDPQVFGCPFFASQFASWCVRPPCVFPQAVSPCSSKEAYLAYRHRTSPLLPLPPVLYARVPLLLKRVLLFEWPMYETDWSYCGEEAGRGILPPHLSSGSASIPGSQSPSAASALMPGAGGGAGPATVANSMRASIGGGASARDARLSVAPPSAHAPTDAVAAVAVNPMDGGSRAV